MNNGKEIKMSNIPKLDLNEFPHITHDKLRYGDTDKQGHINNAVFTTFYETGRVEIVYEPKHQILKNNCSFVIAHIEMNFIAEILWPGKLEIGTAVTKIGNSSVTFLQALYQNGKLVSTNESILVQVSNETKKSELITEDGKKNLEKFIINT